MKSIFIKS